jgi:hypothetical protein
MIGSSVRAKIVAQRSYTRTKEDGTLESWPEVVERCIKHQRWLWERAQGHKLNTEQEEELEILRGLMLLRKAELAGRTLWLGGTQTAMDCEVSQFNCAFEVARTVHDVVDLYWKLLNGTGTGFRIEPGNLFGYTSEIPELEIVESARTEDQKGQPRNHETYDNGVWTIQVGDSAIAWAKAVGKLIAGKHRGCEKLVLDFSQVRGAGGRLKGYGWVCHGFKPFATALTAIHEILNGASGRMLTAMECHEINNWLGTVLSTRRSAQIATCKHDAEWAHDFATFKNDKEKWWRGQSNNTIEFDRKPSRLELTGFVYRMFSNGNGEPGIRNAEAARKRAPWSQGTNPCFAPDTLIPVVDRGLCRISDLEGQTIEVWDGNGQIQTTKVHQTGTDQDLLMVTLSDGHQIRVTPYHNFVLEDGSFVKAEDLVPGTVLKSEFVTAHSSSEEDRTEEARIAAWQIADGTWHTNGKSKVYLYDHKRKYADLFAACKAYHEDRRSTYLLDISPYSKEEVPGFVLEGNEETQLAFIDSYIDSDGHIDKTNKGIILQICSIHRSFLNDLQSLLYNFGVKSKVSLMREGGPRDMPGGTYNCQDCYRLTVTNPAQLLQYIRPEMINRGPYKTKQFITVDSVEDLGEVSDVYCFTVPTTNSFHLGNIVIGQCAEILLPDKGFCNLVEVNLAHKDHEDFGELCETIWCIARANYRQTCVRLDNDPILQKVWHENNQNIRLCGVGLTGIRQRPDLEKEDYVRVMWATARTAADEMADELGTPRSQAVTTIKPSGTMSKIMDCTEGVHMPLGKYIFNRVAFKRTDPLVDMMREAGYTIEDHPFDTESVLGVLPVKYEGLDWREETAVEQLDRYLFWQTNWADHNVSCTIYYEEHEADDIANWLYEHWDDYVAVSFLPRNPNESYAYYPQVAVTEEEYEEYVTTLGDLPEAADKGFLGTIDYMGYAPDKANTDCATGVCPIN